MASAKKKNLSPLFAVIAVIAAVAALYLLSRSGTSVVQAKDGEAAVRLVSVGGAATEIVFALGAGGDVVGVDQASVYPKEARERPQVGYVRTISAEGVLALAPTQIVAGHEIGPANAVAQIKASGLPVLILPKIDTPEDLYGAIATVAETLSREKEAEALIGAIRDTFAKVQTPEREAKVVFMMKPPGSMRLSAAGRGTRADDLIRLAGGRNVVTNFNGYKALSQEALMTLQPDVIIVATAETFENLGTAEEIIADLRTQPGWEGLVAAQNNRLYAVGLGEALSFGPRMADAVLKMNTIFREAATDGNAATAIDATAAIDNAAIDATAAIDNAATSVAPNAGATAGAAQSREASLAAKDTSAASAPPAVSSAASGEVSAATNSVAAAGE